MRKLSKRRPGRPTGPTTGRTQRPWDPRQLSFREFGILRYVADNPHLAQYQIAEHFGISPARLSVLTCCPLGQAFLEALQDNKGSLRSPDEIRELLGPLALRRR